MNTFQKSYILYKADDYDANISIKKHRQARDNLSHLDWLYISDLILDNWDFLNPATRTGIEKKFNSWVSWLDKHKLTEFTFPEIHIWAKEDNPKHLRSFYQVSWGIYISALEVEKIMRSKDPHYKTRHAFNKLFNKIDKD